MNILVFEKSQQVQAEIGKQIRNRLNSFTIFFIERPQELEKINHNIDIIITHFNNSALFQKFWHKAKVILYKKDSEFATIQSVNIAEIGDKL